MFRRVRYYIFLKDVLLVALTAFGGPQAHLAILFDVMVRKRAYLSEQDLIELYALCQILPGPTSTQTITAIGFKIGGPNLAYLTLLVWSLPAVTIMITMAALLTFFKANEIPLDFTRFILPMAVGFVAYAAYKISIKVVFTKTGIIIMICSAVLSFFAASPYLFPVILLIGGLVTTYKYKQHDREETDKLKINWSNFILWAGVFIGVALLGHFTDVRPARLLENFYRNGSLIFGGGQVLIPLLHTEFVEYKDYLTSEEFLTGFALVQSIPGPVFSFSAYVGALSMREWGIAGEIVGGLAAAIGIFLPGTFLIFFVIRFWDQLKKYRLVKASMEGVNAASSGMVVAAAILLFQPLDSSLLNFSLTIGTFCILTFTKIPAPFLILAGLLFGFLL
ncbi:MAG: chromate efflux transporter [Candidatus Cyclobacteriaceae bacterium M2_1C_046]